MKERLSARRRSTVGNVSSYRDNGAWTWTDLREQAKDLLSFFDLASSQPIFARLSVQESIALVHQPRLFECPCCSLDIACPLEHVTSSKQDLGDGRMSLSGRIEEV